MRHRRSHRRGISMMLVTAFIAVASVIGLALLSSAALQSAATRNQDLVVQADALAESGINYGLYWVQNLGDGAKCPAAVAGLQVGGSPAELTGQSVKGIPGTFDLTVSRLSHTRYQVTARGKAPPPPPPPGQPPDPPVERALTTQADANYFGYAISATNLTSTGFTIPASAVVNGDVICSVPVTVASGAKVTGTIYDGPPPASGGLLGGIVRAVNGTLNTVVGTLVPAPSSVNHYGPNKYAFVVDGKELLGEAEEISSGSISETSTWPHDPAKNPARVFYHSGTLELTGKVKINGTLIIKDGGALRLQGQGNVIAQSVPNLPALVVDGNVTYNAASATLDVLGLAYTGGRVNRAAAYTGCVLNVSGALVFGGTTGSVDPAIATTVTYDRVRASVPSLVTTARPMPTSITVVYWKN